MADALRRDSVVTIYIPPAPVANSAKCVAAGISSWPAHADSANDPRAVAAPWVADAPMRQLYSPRGLAWLAWVAVPPAATATLQRLVVVLVEVHRAAPRPRRPDGAGATDPIALALDRLVGIGPVLALTLRAEIGDITRFARRPKLASLAGVVARVESSAGQIYYGRITRQGSPWLRWTLIEAARHAMKRPDAVGRWARRLALRKGLAKARVALVRRLCDDIVTQWPRSV